MYIDKATIVEAEDFCGKEPPFSQGGAYEDREVALQITVDVQDSPTTFQPHIYVGGKLNRQTDDQYKAWGSAWKVRSMLEELGIEPAEIMERDGETFSFNDEGLDAIKGQSIFKLSFYTPTGKRREYDRIVVMRNGESETQAEERLKAMFLQDVSGGYILYSPIREKSGELPFNIMDSGPETEEGEPHTAVPEPDKTDNSKDDSNPTKKTEEELPF